MATALFIDSFSRQIEVSTVSVTEVTGNNHYEAVQHEGGALEVSQMAARKGIVLRFGAQIGNLWQLTTDQIRGEFAPNLPVIVAARGYSAKSSEGFVDVVKDIHGGYRDGHPTRLHTYVLGVQGFPWQTHKSLRVLGNPMEVLVLRPETTIREIETHARRKPGEGWHSNRDTAAAARQGLELRAKVRPHSIFVVEGQSDYAQAWELRAPYESYNEEFSPEFPEEFRYEMFSNENILEKALGRLYKEKASKAAAIACLKAGLAGYKDHTFIGLPWSLLPILGREEIQRLAEERIEELKNQGWVFKFEGSYPAAQSPEGEVSPRAPLYDHPRVEIEFLRLANGMTEDEKREVVASRISSELARHFHEEVATIPHTIKFREGKEDYYVEVEFVEGEPLRLWFAHSDKPGPRGETSNEFSFYSIADVAKKYFWHTLPDIKKIAITVYKAEGQPGDSREWRPSREASSYSKVLATTA